MAKNKTPKGMVASRVHDGSVTKVTYIAAPTAGTGKHYQKSAKHRKFNSRQRRFA